jgi:hypothetical protein
MKPTVNEIADHLANQMNPEMFQEFLEILNDAWLDIFDSIMAGLFVDMYPKQAQNFFIQEDSE